MDSCFVFTRPLTYEVKADGTLEVVGEVSTTHPDLVNDIVSLKCLKSMQKQIQEGNLKIDLEHEAFRGKDHEEKEINKTKIPVGRMIEPTITETKSDKGIQQGLSVKVLFNKNCDKFESVKSNIVNKFLDAFSIAFIPTETRLVMKGKEEFRILDDVRLLNVALTGNPVNTAAQMKQIVVKAGAALDEYKAEKKINPGIADSLEVKNKTSNASRNARNAAIAGDDEDEEEEKKYPGRKKPKVKAYEKDGGHSHEGADPIGEHNHPEIENQIRRDVEFLHDRINSLRENIEESPQMVAKAKSYSKEKNIIIEKEVKMTEKETETPAEETTEETTEEAAKPEAPAEEAAETPAENAEPLNEVKSLIGKVLANQKSINSRLDAIEKKDDEEEPEAPDKEAKSKALAAENSESQNLKADAKAGAVSEIC